MNLESQVCALEYVKRLEELGVKQESLFYWCNVNNWEYKSVLRYCPQAIDRELALSGYAVSAFTVAELGEMLPDNCYTQKDCATLPVEWICHRIIDENQEDIWIGDTEANARVKMLIYLIENKLINISLASSGSESS